VTIGYADANDFENPLDPATLDADNLDLDQTPLQIIISGGLELSIGAPNIIEERWWDGCRHHR
jgi:hypothetical protein